MGYRIQCKRHPELRWAEGAPCPKCMAEMGEDCIRRSSSGTTLHSLLDFPPTQVHRPNLDNVGWMVDEVQAPRYSRFRDFLTKLLNRKENSMKHVFTREISAEFKDLEAAGCVVHNKNTDSELFKVVVWPKDKIDPTVSSRSTQSLAVNRFVVRYIEGGIHPVALEVKLASLQVPYTVHAYDPSKVQAAEPELTPAQRAIRNRQASEKLGDPTVTRVVTVTLANLDAAGYTFMGEAGGMKVMLKDSKDASVSAEQILDDELGKHLTFTFSGLRPHPFEMELAKYRVSHSGVRDVEYPPAQPAKRNPCRSITAQLAPLQTIEGIKFVGFTDQPGWRVNIPGPSTEAGTGHNFVSQASGELFCTALTSDMSLLEELLHHHRVPYEVGYPLTNITNCIRKVEVASIQVAATRYETEDRGGHYEVVGQHDVSRTHWSVYLRDEEGLVTHVEDYPVNGSAGGYAAAMQHAARLSIEHQVPIEPIP